MKTSAMIASSIRELRELASSTVPPSGRDVKSYRESRQSTSPSGCALSENVRRFLNVLYVMSAGDAVEPGDSVTRTPAGRGTFGVNDRDPCVRPACRFIRRDKRTWQLGAKTPGSLPAVTLGDCRQVIVVVVVARVVARLTCGTGAMTAIFAAGVWHPCR
jgi:hypothetical protein